MLEDGGSQVMNDGLPEFQRVTVAVVEHPVGKGCQRGEAQRAHEDTPGIPLLDRTVDDRAHRPGAQGQERGPQQDMENQPAERALVRCRVRKNPAQQGQEA